MCQREKTSLQAGMNFGLGGNHSVILMSLRANAPYRDRIEDGGTTLIYEGHDQPLSADCPNPKLVDQQRRRPSGSLTQNGKFHEAAQATDFDHDLPCSKGGTSITTSNVQLLCVRHNLQKHDDIV